MTQDQQSVGSSTTTNDEAVEAAAAAMKAQGVPPGVLFYENAARIAVAVVAPVVEARVRKQAADELREIQKRIEDERDMDGPVDDWNVALTKAAVIVEMAADAFAARVVRGEQEGRE